MTLVADEQVGTPAAAPRELVVHVDTDPGAAAWQVRFAIQDQPLVRRPQAMTSMRIHIPVEVIPAASGDLERLVEAGERGALPATVVDAVMAQVSSDLAPNGRVALFSREARWAAVIASAIEQVAGRRAPVAELDRARRAQIVRLIEQHSDDPRLSPETIAAALGVSRRTLYLAAEPLGGIAECLRGVRAWRAIERIEDPTDRSSLQVIARESGFTSHRRMTRAINAELGISPAALRTRVQGEAS